MAISYPCPLCGYKYIAASVGVCPSCGKDVRKAKGKKFYVTLWVEMPDGTKRKIRRRAPGKTLEEARMFEVKLKEELTVAGAPLQDPNVRFSRLWQEYVDWCKQTNKPSWVKRKESIYKHWFEPFFGHRKLKHINKHLIEKYISWRIEQGNKAPRGGVVKPHTVRVELAVLKNCLQKAVEWGYLKDNPAKGVKVPIKGTPFEKWHIFTPQEAQRLIEALAPPARYVVELAFYTGWRIGEILNLKWEQVDLERGIVVLSRDETKASKSQVRVLNHEAVKLLEKVKKRYGNSPYVFPSPRTGEPLKGVRKAFKSALKRAGLPTTIRLHDIRHTYISWAIQKGVPMPILQELVGHSTLQMLLHYTHLDAEAKRKEADKITITGEPALRVISGGE